MERNVFKKLKRLNCRLEIRHYEPESRVRVKIKQKKKTKLFWKIYIERDILVSDVLYTKAEHYTDAFEILLTNIIKELEADDI